MADDIMFAEEEEIDAQEAAPDPWLICIVDDERDIHAMTEINLTEFRFEGRPLRFLHAESAAEARVVLAANPGIAVVLLDVVMEHEHAGLDVVDFIRNELDNRMVRIVLRTGQPGSAPELDVIARYDINDYKEKTELNNRKLYTLMHACLRGYRDLLIIEQNRRVLEIQRRSLEQLINSSGALFRLQSLQQFTQAVLSQMTALIAFGNDSFFGDNQIIAQREASDELRIIAGTGRFEQCVGERIDDLLPPQAMALITEQVGTNAAVSAGADYILSYHSSVGRDKVLYLGNYNPTSPFDQHLLTIFSRNAGIAFDNIHLQDAVEATQAEMAQRLGEAIEFRGQELRGHIRRVTHLARFIAERLGLEPPMVQIIEHAMPLHDIGKIAIPDTVLMKPGPLTPEEFAVMKTHPVIGHQMLQGASGEIFSIAANIALDHHEKWNGTGYPNGKAGAGISLEGRIAAAADVFDALANARCYKPAWEAGRIRAFYQDNAGVHFDPEIAAVVLEDFDAILAANQALAPGGIP